MGLHRYGVTFVHSEEGSRIGGQIVCRVITRAFLSVLLLTVLTCPFIIGASYVVWSPIATDVVTDAMAFIEVMPEQARLCEVLLFYPFLFHFFTSFLSSLIVEGHAPIRPPKGHYGFASRPSSIALTSTPKGQRYSEEQFRSDHDTTAYSSKPNSSTSTASEQPQQPRPFSLSSPLSDDTPES